MEGHMMVLLQGVSQNCYNNIGVLHNIDVSCYWCYVQLIVCGKIIVDNASWASIVEGCY